MGAESNCVPRRWLINWVKFSGARMVRSPAHAASAPFWAGQTRCRSPAFACRAAGRIPVTWRTEPSRDNSPSNICSLKQSDGNTPIAVSKPIAIGKSKWAPSLSKSAGDRFTAIRLAGNASPREERAARTRSLDSATALSGSPTIAIAGRPLSICT